MGKVIIEFDSLEEKTEINDAINGWKWKMSMNELDQILRKTTKYGVSVVNKNNEEASDLEYEIAERYREILREVLSDNNLFLED
jgi:hypothetical protein